jgi:hypothetical protein
VILEVTKKHGFRHQVNVGMPLAMRFTPEGQEQQRHHRVVVQSEPAFHRVELLLRAITPNE